MQKLINPEFIRVRDPRLVWILALAWHTVPALSFVYALYLALGLMAGMTLVDTTALYLRGSIPALELLFAIGVGSWLLFSYLYSITVPPAEAIEQGRSLACYGFHAFKIRLVDIGLTIASSAVSLSAPSLKLIPLENSPLLRLARRGLPVHLALGWFSGAHPPLVYE